MTIFTATANFGSDLSASKKSAPIWVELFPAGPNVKARDGRAWTANPAAMLAAFEANRAPLPIDYEHGQDLLADKGHAAPAAGWIVELQDRAGAVWGRVEWTDRAAAAIVAREYRFLSPAFQHDDDGVVTRLLGAGLVNRPALEMTALSRDTQTKETPMLKAIAKALGLPETADEPAVLQAITDRSGKFDALCKALELDPAKADEQTALAAANRLKAATGKSVEKDTEIAALNTALTDTRNALAALQTKDRDRDIDAALDAAAAEGKITPASRETYRALCQSEGGLDRFKALAATLPVICQPSQLDGKATPTDAAANIDPVALAAAGRKYQDEQAAIGRTVSISEAIEAVKAKEAK